MTNPPPAAKDSGSLAGVRPSDIPGCVELSLDFLLAMLNYGQWIEAPVAPKPVKTSGPVKAKTSNWKARR